MILSVYRFYQVVSEAKLKFKYSVHHYPGPQVANDTCYFVWNTWDDFGFKTTYRLIYVDKNDVQHRLGSVRILKMGMTAGKTEIPDEFEQLSDEYCSLGSNRNFYINIRKLPPIKRKEIMRGIRDCVLDKDRFKRFSNEPGMLSSLLRDSRVSDVENSYRAILKGHVDLTKFRFDYETAPSEFHSGMTLNFMVQPHSKPPSNIHVLIGRNGVGKTRLLAGMADTFTLNKAASFGIPGKFTFDEGEEFKNLVVVSFSAFDRFDPIPQRARTDEEVPYYYVGIKVRQEPDKLVVIKSPDQIDKEFKDVAENIAADPDRLENWVEVLKLLCSDPLIADLSPDELLEEDNVDALDAIIGGFTRMSSGHKIVLLTITKLAEYVSDRSLILLDEPETHLHPPLLGSFIRALSELLVLRNGVAIIATHSPVVLQEVPKNCAWYIGPAGAERPEIETFAENVSILTRKVFGLELEKSGFYRLLKEEAEQTSYEDVLDVFENQVGAEGRALIRAFTWKADPNA